MMNAYRGYLFFVLPSPGARVLLVLAVVWTLIWKGMALWKSGQNGQKAWFVVLFLLNTLGILDIVYLVWFAKKK
jgi:methionyl-tRNA synthetase